MKKKLFLYPVKLSFIVCIVCALTHNLLEINMSPTSTFAFLKSLTLFQFLLFLILQQTTWKQIKYANIKSTCRAEKQHSYIYYANCRVEQAVFSRNAEIQIFFSFQRTPHVILIIYMETSAIWVWSSLAQSFAVSNPTLGEKFAYSELCLLLKTASGVW